MVPSCVQWTLIYFDHLTVVRQSWRRLLGLTEASGTAADLIAVYHFSTQEVADSTTTSDGFGMGGGPWGGGWSGMGGWSGWGMGGGMGGGISTTETEPRTMGILTIDLVDSKTKQVVWRGQATEDKPG